MRLARLMGAGLIAAGLALGGGDPVLAASPHYRVTASIAAPDGGWDYAGVDAGRTLYVARSDSVTAIALATGRITRFGVLARAHAVVPIETIGVVLVTSGEDGTVRLFDTATSTQLASIKVGEDPDGAVYDPATHLAYVIDGEPGRVVAIDPATRQLRASIAVSPGLEFPAFSRKRLYVNNEAKGDIEVIDLERNVALAPIAMPGCEHPTGLAYDERSDRLISACANGKAAVIDASARRVVAMLSIGRGPDAVILDAARRLAFIPCGRDGVLEVLALDAAGGIEVVDRVTTEIGARTGALDPATGAVYLPTARLQPPASADARPVRVPGTFHVLVVRPR